MSHRHEIEIELKYEVVRRGGGDGYLVAPELGPYKPAGPVRSVGLEDRYVDTADWGLAKAGFAARLRSGSRGTLMSLKAAATGKGPLEKRREIEGPADPDLGPGAWPDSAARTTILELIDDRPLEELLTIRQQRRTRKIETDGGTAELSVDEVEVLCGGATLDSFDELGVELKSGPEEPLAELAAMFDRDEGLRQVSRSKLDRAAEAVRRALPGMPESVRRRWQDAPAELPSGRPSGSRRSRPTSAKGKAAEGREKTVASMATGDGVADGPATRVDGTTREPAPAQPTKPGPRTLGVVPDDSLPEAAGKVLRFHFTRMQNREAGTRSGSDTEDLHDMRIAVRRMRAAWRVFDGAFKPGRTRRLRRRLETISDRLGAVRDLDVLIEGLEAYCAGLDPEQRPGLDSLLALWEHQRAGARKLLIAELDSGGYAAFVREMGEFLADGVNSAAFVPGPTAPHRVRDRAPSLIWRCYESVRAYELVLPWADMETLHRLRIATKWLRYALEFFAETLGRDGPNLLARVVALQDYLGLLHDADVAAKLARDELVARAGELSRVEAEAIGSYLHYREREVARRRRALGPVWRAVDGAPFRRALGRATAVL